jgi:hypothetical protein
MYKNIIMVAVALILPLKGRANDLHLNLSEKAYEVLAPKTNAINLKQVNDLVVNDQLDLQISYERLLQAQKKIGLARAQYFPYGLGTVAAMYFMNIWNPLILIELVTSLPTKIYSVQSEKNMSMAQQYSSEALKQNIKNQVAHLYYNVLKEEGGLKLAKMELVLLETLYKVTEERVTLGLSTETELRVLEVRLLDLRDICLKFAGYLSAEKAAFNIMISQMPSQVKVLELQTEGTFLNVEDFGLTSEVIKFNAVDRSPEIVAADYMITAASKSKNSIAWSVLSFSGIGFDYWGRIQVAGSKTEQAKLNRELVETTLANQSYVINNSFHRTLDHLTTEQSVFNDTALFYAGDLAKFKSNDIALDQLAESGIIFLKDFRELFAAHYESLKKLNDLERIALGDVKGSSSDSDKLIVNLTHMDRNKCYLSVSGDQSIKSVQYVFDDFGFVPMSSANIYDGFAVSLKLSGAENLNGHVNVLMKSGKVITKQFKF